jgi:hypothetical protein
MFNMLVVIKIADFRVRQDPTAALPFRQPERLKTISLNNRCLLISMDVKLDLSHQGENMP